MTGSGKYRFLFFVVFYALFSCDLRGQCSIAAKREVCADDLVNFNLNTSGSIVSYDWDFSSFGTSTNASPLIKFTSSAAIVVTCTVTYSGGGQCSDTHQLQINSLPNAKFSVDAKSVFCLKENKVCINDSSTIGKRGIQKITLVWGDGKIEQFAQPVSKQWCHIYGDTGLHNIHLEIEDSSACKDNFDYTVHLAPSVIHQITDLQTEICDSIKICLNKLVSGGNNISSGWYILPMNKAITGSSFCAVVQPEDSLKIKFFAQNEYGCKDSLVYSTFVPSTTFFLEQVQDSFCSADLQSGPVGFVSGETVEWWLNGVMQGKDSFFRVPPFADIGKNYIEIVRLFPCSGYIKDSFTVLGVPAAGMVFNKYNRSPQDTAFFVDTTPRLKDSRFSRMWNFGDINAEQCITNTAKGINADRNCNYSVDSIGRHFYKDTACYSVTLVIYDSITKCSDYQLMDVYRKDWCSDFFAPPNVCRFETANFTVPVNMRETVLDSIFLITDIRDPRDTVKLYKGHAFTNYTTNGLKSPILWRYYGADTVWTERNGKIVVSFVRNGDGWVADTFKNRVDVNPKSEADFDVVKVSDCWPFKARLVFRYPDWLFPDSMFVSWGDTSEVLTNFSDSIHKLIPIEHTYLNGGLYEIKVNLKPYKGCEGTHIAEVQFSHAAHFRSFVKCHETPVCFKDSVVQMGIIGPQNLWNATGVYGQLYWDYGDGTKDSGYNRCHQFPGKGTYVVTLTAVNKSGCAIPVKDTITLTGPSAQIKSFPEVYCNETKQYFDSSFIIPPVNGQVVNQWTWDFSDGSAVSKVKNPVHIFPGGGQYNIKLLVKTNLGCTDTVSRMLKVIGPEVKAKIISDSAGCNPLKVTFDNLSKLSKNFIWQFGDKKNTQYSTNQDTNTSFTYNLPGIYYPQLIGGDSFFNPTTGSRYYCTVKFPGWNDTALRIVVHESVYASFRAAQLICVNDSIRLVNTSSNDSVKYLWNFGDGNTEFRGKDSFSYKYAQPGTYRISLIPQLDTPTKAICYDSANRSAQVIVLQPDFKHDCNSNHGSELILKNTSGLVIEGYQWTLLNPDDSSEIFLSDKFDLLYDFGKETGLKKICLGLVNSSACGGKVCKDVYVGGGVLISNVFTPGKDGFNDSYKIPIQNPKKFYLSIYNRWGELIFESDTPTKEWNGQVFNSGPDLPEGTYFYRLESQSQCEEKEKVISGSIMLIR